MPPMSPAPPGADPERRRARPLWRLLRAAALGFGLYALAVALVQRSLLFPGTELRAPEGLDQAVPDVERLWFEADDGRTEAWLLPAPAHVPRPAPAVLAAHGNYELIDYQLPFAQALRALGAHVLLVEYPGYGRSTGSPTQESVTAAFVAARDALAARPDVDAGRIAYYGREPAALVLQSTFTSVRAMAASLFVPGFLIRDPFESLDWLERWTGPALVLHGRRDDVVPFEHGEALAGAGARLEVFDCRHNDFPDDPERYWRVLGTFLTEAGVLDGPGVAAAPEGPAGG